VRAVADRVRVTTVIPTRDRRRLVPRAIACAAAQRDVEHEVVVVDDGSRDGTAEAVAALPHTGVRVVRHDRPRGVAAARNSGIAAARGEWVAFLDDDDVWAPHKLATLTQAAASAGWAFSAAVNLDEQLRVIDFTPVPAQPDLHRAFLAANAMPGGCSNAIVRTDLVRELGGFDERIPALSDWDLWIRLAGRAAAARVAEPLAGYVEHGESMHVRGERMTRDELPYLAAKHADARVAAGVSFAASRHRVAAYAHHSAGRRLPAVAALLRAAAVERSLPRRGELRDALEGPARAGRRRRRWAAQSGEPEPAWLAAVRDAMNAAS
jgi:Glycosyl transferase family 2